MAELPSMDDILRDAKKREKRGNLTVGAIALAGGLAVLVGFQALGSTPGYALYLVPGGAIAFGVARLASALSA